MHESKILQGAKQELWHGLVKHGEQLAGKNLPDELQHYLITVFDRTFETNDEQPSFVDGSVVVMLSEALNKTGHEKRNSLKYLGDVCLLRAGFSRFVSRTFKRMTNNPKQFYVSMGVTSFMFLYSDYENHRQRQQGATYRLVAQNLHSLVAVLSSIEHKEPVVEKLQRVTVGNVTYL
jgi:hypothetical protein